MTSCEVLLCGVVRGVWNVIFLVWDVILCEEGMGEKLLGMGEKLSWRGRGNVNVRVCGVSL